MDTASQTKCFEINIILIPVRSFNGLVWVVSKRGEDVRESLA
jgi:hypothetical protein